MEMLKKYIPPIMRVKELHYDRLMSNNSYQVLGIKNDGVATEDVDADAKRGGFLPTIGFDDDEE